MSVSGRCTTYDAGMKGDRFLIVADSERQSEFATSGSAQLARQLARPLKQVHH